MEKHLLISTLIESLVFFNNKLIEIAVIYGIKLFSSFTTNCHLFYEVDEERLLYRLNYLEGKFKDNSFKLKSKYRYALFYSKLTNLILN